MKLTHLRASQNSEANVAGPELSRTGVPCTECGKLGASAQDEADHNTGSCHCPTACTLCWREWWLDRCQA